MGCSASSQNGRSPHQNGHGKVVKDCIDPETGERETCEDMVGGGHVSKGPQLIKTNSLTINDESEKCARTGEEPAHPLPEGDYGDMRLGITVSACPLTIGLLLRQTT